MGKFCGPSPCDGLLAAKANGRWLWDDTPGEPIITPVIIVATALGPEKHRIEYCPFCGTQLDRRRARNHSEFVPKRARRMSGIDVNELLGSRTYSLEEMVRIMEEESKHR